MSTTNVIPETAIVNTRVPQLATRYALSQVCESFVLSGVFKANPFVDGFSVINIHFRTLEESVAPETAVVNFAESYSFSLSKAQESTVFALPVRVPQGSYLYVWVTANAALASGTIEINVTEETGSNDRATHVGTQSVETITGLEDKFGAYPAADTLTGAEKLIVHQSTLKSLTLANLSNYLGAFADASVNTFADLPLSVAVAPVGSHYVVNTSTGIWFVDRKEAGWYYRSGSTGTAADWQRLGKFEDGMLENFTPTEKAKLSGIAVGATANATDVQLRDRSTHTGTQAPSTILLANTSRLLGRTTAGSGGAEELTVGTSLSLSGGTLNTVQNLSTTGTPTFSHLFVGDAYLDKAANTDRMVRFRTSGVARWSFGAVSNTETGVNNAGSDVALYRMSDAGAYLDTLLYASRSAGTVSLYNRVGVGMSAQNDAVLSIKATSTVPPLYVYSSTNNVLFRVSLGGAVALRPDSATDTVLIHPGGISYLNGGDVGIGTTSPACKLDVRGAIATNAPSGGSVGLWKLGTYSATTVTPDGHILVQIGADTYKIPADKV